MGGKELNIKPFGPVARTVDVLYDLNRRVRELLDEIRQRIQDGKQVMLKKLAKQMGDDLAGQVRQIDTFNGKLRALPILLLDAMSTG